MNVLSIQQIIWAIQLVFGTNLKLQLVSVKESLAKVKEHIQNKHFSVSETALNYVRLYKV